MTQLWQRLQEVEPARVWLAVRVLGYILVGATGSWLAPDDLEQILAILAVLLGVDAATTEATRSKVYSPKSASDILAAAFVGAVGGYIRTVVENTLPKNKVTEGLQAALPILAEFAQANLDTETRAKIQRKVHLALHSRGLIPKRNVPPSVTSIVLILPLVLALSACVPIADLFGSTVEQINAGGADLAVVETGIAFDPGEDVALAVLVTMYADEANVTDERCDVTTLDELAEVTCDLGDVAEETTIALSATNLSATATYQRTGSARFYSAVLD